MPSNRLWCRECENHVSPDYPHSCYNAQQVRAVRDAEAAVVGIAEHVVSKLDIRRIDGDVVYFGLTETQTLVALEEAVRALHAARGHSPQDAEGITRQGVQDGA
ncbi:MAG: hypothetical protein HEQ38_17225 [Gemmatimonas sp.]|nr:hypothetical protein [Gemmatimonas sp.]